MALIQVKPDDIRQLQRVLVSTFRGPTLQRIVESTIPEVQNDIIWQNNLADIVAELIRVANQYGVLDKLLIALAEERPERPDLRALLLLFSQLPGWSVRYGTHTLHNLERLTSQGSPFMDMSRLAAWMIASERRLCQIKVGMTFGTGFLIAPDLVLTCYHVVEAHLKQRVAASDVQIRFDFYVSPNNTAPSPSLPWESIDPAWKIIHRPYSPADLSLQGDPAPEDLDYAVLKLRNPVGNERGWIDISQDVPPPAPEAPLLIAQHPGQAPDGRAPQQPLQIAFATPGFESMDATGTRLIHFVSTLPGSSGGLVVGPDFRACGLHHNRGDLLKESKRNRAVLLSSIRKDLESSFQLTLLPFS